jgi:hypothetical protein
MAQIVPAEIRDVGPLQRTRHALVFTWHRPARVGEDPLIVLATCRASTLIEKPVAHVRLAHLSPASQALLQSKTVVVASVVHDRLMQDHRVFDGGTVMGADCQAKNVPEVRGFSWFKRSGLLPCPTLNQAHSIVAGAAWTKFAPLLACTVTG